MTLTEQIDALIERNVEWWKNESHCKGEMRELGVPEDADAPVVSMGDLYRLRDALASLPGEAEADAYLVEYREDEGGSRRHVCTASLEPREPLCFLPEDANKTRTLIKATPLYARPQGQGWIAPEIQTVMEEIGRAVQKFPTWPTDPLHAVAVLGEEYGELVKATLQLTYEPHKVNVEEWRKEAVQTAAMALRFLLSLDAYQFARCEQHEQAPGAAR